MLTKRGGEDSGHYTAHRERLHHAPKTDLVLQTHGLYCMIINTLGHLLYLTGPALLKGSSRFVSVFLFCVTPAGNNVTGWTRIGGSRDPGSIVEEDRLLSHLRLSNPVRPSARNYRVRCCNTITCRQREERGERNALDKVVPIRRGRVQNILILKSPCVLDFLTVFLTEKECGLNLLPTRSVLWTQRSMNHTTKI